MNFTIPDRFAVALVAALMPCMSAAFNSGSTGADGDFNPTVNLELQLPPSGIFNFRSVNVPNGVTITFKRNATNTPVVMLVQGDAAIHGVLVLDGGASRDTGNAGDGNVQDDGMPGKGGPGGFDGGHGGLPKTYDVVQPDCSNFFDLPQTRGGDGLGPGGGLGTQAFLGRGGSCGYWNASSGNPGVSSSNAELQPLIGGSGGGGSPGGQAHIRGVGGGGGGGALLLAVSGTLRVNGRISAKGGGSGAFGFILGDVSRTLGGVGSGGSIRIVATTLSGAGNVFVSSPVAVSHGRVRVELEFYNGQLVTDALTTFGPPGQLFLSGLPGLRFTRVGAATVPASPTGSSDVTLPAAASGVTTVELQTSAIPVGSVIKVVVTPSTGAGSSVDAPPTTGSVNAAVTSASVEFPVGHSVLSASVTYTVTAAAGAALSRFAQGEPVQRITLTAHWGSAGTMSLETVSGRHVEVVGQALAMALAEAGGSMHK